MIQFSHRFRSVAWMILFSLMAPSVSDSGIGSQGRSGASGASKPAAQGSAGNKASSKGAKESDEENEGEKNAPAAIGALFPVGREFTGVKIPSYSGDALNSVVTAETMIRVDDEHMKMEQLVITLFGTGAEGNTTITTDRGVYDLKSESLTSRTKAYISREGEFDMVGDRMIFDGATQEGRLIGNVKMQIYKISENFGNP